MSKQSRIANPRRRLAAQMLKAGASRIWMDPAAAEKISHAITRADMRRLMKKSLIKILRARKPSPQHEACRQGIGSRKGTHMAREGHGKKETWLKAVRPQRALLVEVKAQLKPLAYRKLYMMIKGGAFRSRAHIQAYMKEQKLMRK